MAKQKVTTQSTKRYRYSSFKNKIDDLKIEPARNLQKRVHDYVESSHFLASFDHWKEINLSAAFSNFSYEVKDLVQTLPQILYHEEKIFDLLVSFIDKHEESSLQPLLDLLAQLCHDLGPDFLKFYKKALLSLIQLLEEAVNFESTNVFEWGFNCLAYIFKYLSRYLSDDIVPTFDLLFPLLSHSKDYISRFSAEAMSFLIRKSSSKKLGNFVSYTFRKLREDNEKNFHNGLLTLFTEALTSTTGALHSKSKSIVDLLLDEVLAPTNTNINATFFCDVWMNISKYASIENIAPLYDSATIKLKTGMDSMNLDKILMVLSALVFSESGKKVNDWGEIMSVTIQTISQEDRTAIRPESVAFLFAVLIRNSDIKSLTQYHKKFFEYYLSEYPNNFLEFFKSVLSMSSERALSFSGAKYLQQYINTNWQSSKRKIALFLLDLEGSQTINHLNPGIPHDFVSSILLSLKSFSQQRTDEDLFEIYCNTIILRRSSAKDIGNADIMLLTKQLLKSSQIKDDFEKDVLGSLLQVTSIKKQADYCAFLENILERVPELRDSLFFVEGFNRFLNQSNDCLHLNEIFESHENSVLALSDNLLLPDGKIRYESLKLLNTIFLIQGKEFPQILNECKIIEEIPLTLQNARDITTRIRNMGSHYADMESNKLVTASFLKHMFGLLTIHFSPVWEGVYEIIPNIYGRDQELVWTLLIYFLKYSDNKHILKYYEGPLEGNFEFNFWNTNITRLRDTIQAFCTTWTSYLFHDSTIINMLKERRGNLEVSGRIRSQVLKVMLMIPQLAERRSRDIVPFLFNQAELEEVFQSDDKDENDENIISSAATWTEADRNSLLKVFGKFKNIKAVYKAHEVQQRLMALLGSRSTDVQRLALDALLAYRDPIMIKYRDNLKNLLDDTLFKDEIIRLLDEGDSRIIEEKDEKTLMPYIIRIFFGRAQTPSTSGIKKGRKHAVISVLPSLRDNYIIEFLKLGSRRLNYEYFYENGHKIDEPEFSLITLRRMAGFVNILNASLAVLGSNFPHVMITTIRPLLYTISMSYSVLNKESKEAHMEKIVSNLRQQAIKCLNGFFQNMGDSSELQSSIDDIYTIAIRPRIEHFEDENLQQVSSMMKMIASWASDKALYPFLYYDEYSAASALMKVLAHESVKESVVATILEAANDVVTSPVNSSEYVELVTIIAATCLQILPSLYKKFSNPELVSVAVDLLLNLIESGYVQDNETRKYLIDSLTLVMRDNFKGVNKKDVAKVLKVLAVLIRKYECSWSDVEDLYKALSGLYRVYPDRDIREVINVVFQSFGKQFPNLEKVAQLLTDLNSYSSKRIQEYDFPRRLSAFKSFTEKDYNEYTELEWLPILFTCLFCINDQDELAIRSNASHTLCKFVDYTNDKLSPDSATGCITILKENLLPHIRTGLRKYSEDVQVEYISVLSYIIKNARYFKELQDMQVLLFDGDEEANFFTNVNHIQLHRRLRAIKRLGDAGHELTGGSISHYLIPIIEHYVFSPEEKYRNIGNEALLTIGSLSNFMNWNQYKALMRRYISLLKSKPEQIKETVGLIIQISVALRNTLCNVRGKKESSMALRKFPNKLEDPDKFITDEVCVTLSKILNIRDNETIVVRMPLAEALVNLIMGLKQEDTVSLLPGILTSICQVLRSKSEELRDAVRKSLARITLILGSTYLPFIIKELSSALKRGSQIHVLSYTVHHVIKSLEDELQHSDLDSSSDMVVRIIMEDIFGSAGEEKDSENYHTKMKEVKSNRSYDTGEMLSANISLPTFGILLHPVKALLMQRMNLKTQNKLDELLRRYSLGLKHNSEASSVDVLTVCYEIFLQSQQELPGKHPNVSLRRHENEEFFLVNVNPRNAGVHNETSLVNFTLQKFALDLLHSVLFKHRHLLDVAYLDGFIPLLKDSLLAENEGVLVSSLRVSIILVKLEFPEESENVFKACSRKVLNIIKDSPSTSTELCQMGLKFLSSFIRHKDIKLKDTALSYVLGRILPDLNEPNKQGLAFNFLKALVSKHTRLPEIYDVIDSVREIMVTNHSKEIRDVSRSVYFQFLMEYDQSRGRLEKQFKFMIDNLQYPSQEGRQSVMELINLIVSKANIALISKLSSSFFLALANVSFNDDAARCREMATLLLSSLLQKLGPSDLEIVTKYIVAWLKQIHEAQFLGLGLRIYKIYVSSIGFEQNSVLNELAINRIKMIISDTDVGSDIQWDLVYTALSVFAVYAQESKSVYMEDFKGAWNNVFGCLLYPHLWVRQSAARLVNGVINNLDKFEEPFTDLELQMIVSRILRQLGAPSISEDLASTSVKTLVKIAMCWKQSNASFIQKNMDEDKEPHYANAIDYMISRLGAIIRSEENRTESFMSKKSCIQLFGLLIQILDEGELNAESEKFVLPLFTYIEYDASSRLSDTDLELSTLAQECLQILESKMSVSEFTRAYANVKQHVSQRRHERRAKRSILAVTDPEIAAQRKLKKHARSRQKRKHEKDENGYYQRKNQRKRT